MAQVINVGLSDDPYIGALEFGGDVWTSTGTPRDPVTVSYFLSNDLSAWSQIETTAYVSALQSWANVANITITAASSAASADLVEYSAPPSYFGDPSTYGIQDTPQTASQTTGQVAYGHFNYEGFGWDHDDPNGGLRIGGNGYWTLIHELGHGLGLAHPHDNGGGSSIFPGVGDSYSTGSNGLNQGIWTVMSYVVFQDRSQANTDREADSVWYDGVGNAVGTYGYFAGPMAFDIAAIQTLYGANPNYHAGVDTYVLPDANAGGTYWTCIWDTGGTDSITYGGSRNVTIDLRAATLDNSSTGGGVISAADGIMGGYTIANGVVIENAFGGNGNDTLTGNSAANALFGGGGADRLDGGGGADSMTGGAGSDTYYVDHAGDRAIESNVAGTDLVYASVSYSLIGFYLENLTLTGTDNLTATGNALANTLTGNAGANILDGASGVDTMIGGAGSDTYYVDNAGDRAVEANVIGIDLVYASVSYSIKDYYLENLTLTGSGAINGTGNALANSLTGNANANTLDAGGGNDILNGGAGADTMYGGSGSDIYYVDTTGDRAIEANVTGTDLVYASVSFSLNGYYLENLTLTGSADIDATGNALANTLIGNAGANALYGAGGADTMIGGAGSDTYFVDNVGDRVVEANVAGTDLVYSSVSFSITDYYIENLVFTGTADTNGAGNALANLIRGNDGNNVLEGGGGADTIVGRAGNDTFLFNTGFASSNIDRIADFSSTDDTIQLDRTIFSSLDLGVLSADAYKDIGDPGAVVDADDRILYDDDTGQLFYDSNGAAAGGRSHFATLDNRPATLTASDFFVIA